MSGTADISKLTTDLQAIRALIALRQPWHGLPREFYQNESLYQHEMDRIWRSGWVFAGHACQIPNAGDFFTLQIGGDPLIVIRDETGGIRGFHNICTHRGTLLCTELSGHRRKLVCPYHLWTFGLNGELLSCSGMPDEIDRKALGLRQLPLEVCQGLVFLSLAQNPPAFGPARQLLETAARPQGFEQAKVARTIEYDIPANWKLVWENNRECYHCKPNHPQYVKSNFDMYEDPADLPLVQQRMGDALAKGQRIWTEQAVEIAHTHGGIAPFPDAENNISYSATRTVMAEGYESETMDGRLVAPLMGDYQSPAVGVLRLRALPNFWNHSSCDHAVTTRLLPTGLHRTQAQVTWLVRDSAVEGVDYQLDRLLPFWQLTSEQNWELCQRAQRGVNSSAYRPGPLSPAREYNLEAFLKWYLRRISA